MKTLLNPYLSFKDTARQAMEFYQSVLGGKLDMNTFKEYETPVEPDEENNIMHAMLVTEGGLTLMGADTPKHMQVDGQPIGNASVSLSGDDDAELSGYFEKLSDGATVTMPLGQSPWGDKFGMLTDKFGVTWMVNISAQK